MSKILPAILFSFTSLVSITLSASNPTDWETYFENDTVKIEYKYQNCEYTQQFNSEFVIFKISNLTNNTLSLEWNEQLWYDGNCVNCETDSEENRKQITILPTSITKGICNMNNPLRIFSKFTEKLEDMPGVNKINALTKFELINLKIK
tara:strand:- start:728 stop:1174 length:447 start_codon:yes stop_codon:yes gene_type:complete